MIIYKSNYPQIPECYESYPLAFSPELKALRLQEYFELYRYTM